MLYFPRVFLFGLFNRFSDVAFEFVVEFTVTSFVGLLFLIDHLRYLFIDPWFLICANSDALLWYTQIGTKVNIVSEETCTVMYSPSSIHWRGW